MNRITPYEAGWLSFLVERGLASEWDARAAQNRVALAAIEEIERERAARRRRKKKRRKRSDDQ
jgi:hypothetical protein